MLATLPVAVADEAQDELLLDGVLQSKCFERASSLRRLLQYLWKNRCCEISEYAIATEALGRKHDFDSKVDATVRVQIGRLRQFLAKYYETEGALCRRGINIPVGSHQLCVIDLYGEESSPERALPSSALGTVNPSGGEIAAEPARKANDRRRYWLLPLLASSVLSGLIMFALTLLPSVRGGKQGAVAGRNELPVFWKRFIDNGRSTRIVLPAPLFFAWEPKDGGTLMVRDISVNDPGRSEESPQIVELEKRLGKPRQWQNYTVASDTFASLRLARFLDGYGVRTTFSSSTDSPHEIVDHENIVAFGTASSLAAYQTDLDRLSFKMGPHERYVTDLQLPAGSRPRFSLVEESG
ncbi:MAG TPA: hypothetical protein VK627_09290, partial [Edaphobacter sp.]|nr:hypothetical protein [Edaphobacter sp.]